MVVESYGLHYNIKLPIKTAYTYCSKSAKMGDDWLDYDAIAEITKYLKICRLYWLAQWGLVIFRIRDGNRRVWASCSGGCGTHISSDVGGGSGSEHGNGNGTQKNK